MADKTASVRVTGLTEFRKELARLDNKTFTNELKDAHKSVADLVVGRAKTGASLPVQRKAAGSLKSSRAASKAMITYGGPAYPYAMGAEFGSDRYRQFPPHLGRTGYFVYPAIRDSSGDIVEIYLKATDHIMKRAFPD